MVALESNFPLSNNIFTIGFAKTIAPTDTGIIINITIFNDFLIISLNSLESSSLDSLEKIGYITDTIVVIKSVVTNSCNLLALFSTVIIPSPNVDARVLSITEFI